MKMNARGLGFGAVALALGIGFLATDASSAADEKELRSAVLKIATAYAKQDAAAAKKQAAAVAKANELLDVMNLLGLRKKGGFGIGDKPDAITPDGIEAKLIGLGRKPLPKVQIDKEAADLEQAGYRTAAIAAIALQFPPEKDQGMKTKKAWNELSQQMLAASLKLAAAAKSKDPAEVKTMASSLNSSCNNCHSIFRD